MYIVFYFFISGFFCVHSMAIQSLEHVFSRHTPFQMKIICKSLHEYAIIKSSELSGPDKFMFEAFAKNLYDSLDIINESSSNRVIFGWIPLNDDTYSQHKITRNDNEPIIESEKIPLYFIFVKVSSDNKLIIEKIIHNPSIDSNIELGFMKEHLQILAKESETELDITPLKDNDNGRWYLILSDIINFKSLPNI